MKKYSFTFYGCLLLALHLNAQTPSDSAATREAMGNAVAVYKTAMKDNQRLFNGSEYINYDIRTQGDQFFESNKMKNGSVMYDGVLFENTPLLYDLMLNEVITEHYSRMYKIRLVSEKISYFVLGGHTFIRLVKDSASSSLPETGFYDVLCNGMVKLYATRKKTIEDDHTEGTIISEFVQRNFYYIMKDGVCFPVRSKASALRIFRERRKEIRQYLKTQRVNFKTQREKALTLMTEQYNKLTGR